VATDVKFSQDFTHQQERSITPRPDGQMTLKMKVKVTHIL